MGNLASKHNRAMRWTYQTLIDRYGLQSWWPGDSPFEVMVGAILTQNTAWTNVEKAIANLKRDQLLDAQAIVKLSSSALSERLRPSGYYNVKARRLKNYCVWYTDNGGFESLCQQSTEALRKALLAINGVGEETADDILLYAFNRPVFVVDAYTRRIFQRMGFISGHESYAQLNAMVESVFTGNTQVFNELHALLVQHAKQHCKRAQPQCADCCLKSQCAKIF